MMNSDDLTPDQWQLMMDNRDLIEPIVRFNCGGHDPVAWSAGQDGLVDAAAQYIETKGPFKCYARRIIKRRVVAFRKKRQRQKAVDQEAVGELPELMPFEPTADLEEIIKPLDPVTQRAIRLRYEGEGMTYKDIGKAIGYHPATAQRIVTRGIKQLHDIARGRR